jgi:hypothetical protein
MLSPATVASPGSLACHLLLLSREARVITSPIELEKDAQAIDKLALLLDSTAGTSSNKSLCLRHLGSENRRLLGRDR